MPSAAKLFALFLLKAHKKYQERQNHAPAENGVPDASGHVRLDAGTDFAETQNLSGPIFSNPQTGFGDFEDLSNAGTYSDDIRQQFLDTCAVKSQQMVLERFGINIPEEDLAREAMQRGWYEPGEGTPPDAVGNLLELYGVPVNRFENANIFTLQNELAQGHQVIVPVDADELWDDMDLRDQANHALVVSHIDVSSPGEPLVTLKDPGTGYIEQYSWSKFEDAWQDGNCQMVSTKEPARQEFAPEMEHFDYESGHIADFGDFSYDGFLAAHAEKLSLPEPTGTEFSDSAGTPDFSETEIAGTDFSDHSPEIGRAHV